MMMMIQENFNKHILILFKNPSQRNSKINKNKNVINWEENDQTLSNFIN